MSNTITLPDHISFEEIALKWCRKIDEFDEDDKRSIIYKNSGSNDKTLVKRFWQHTASSHGWDGWEKNNIAEFYSYDRSLIVHYDDVFRFILDYIKERSNV